MADNNSLVKSNAAQGIAKQLERSLKVGSLKDFARSRREANVVLLMDCSGSMSTPLYTSTKRERRIDGLRSVVSEITTQMEGQIRMIAFQGGGYENAARFVTSVPNPSGGTPLAQAIDFAREQGVGRLVCISDGEPDNPVTALEAAQRFGGRIDVVFVGEPGSGGERFMQQLAEASGGQSFTGNLAEVKLITAQVMGFLTGGTDDDDDE